MPVRKISIIIVCFLIIIISGCNSQSNPQNLSNGTATIIVEQTGTALAASGVLETPGFTLNTPSASSTTPTPTSTPLISDGSKLAVVMIKEGDVLNVQASPGGQSAVLTTLSAHAIDISYTGNSQELDGENWFEIRTVDNLLGWVKAENVTEQVISDQFCADNQINTLISQFMKTIQSRDGVQFAQLINPRRGLIIKHEWWNPDVRYIEHEVLENIFDDDTNQDWGVQDGSGLPIVGAFKDVILPKLDDIQNNSVLICNNLDQGLASGGSTGYIQWPFEYANFNYVAIYRAAPEGDELNWRTWAIGVEYVSGKPYVTFLVQYHWEN